MPTWTILSDRFCANRPRRVGMIGFKGKNTSFFPDPRGLKGGLAFSEKLLA